MAFSICCTNKGCSQIQEPYLDADDNKVYCSKCNREIVNVTDFVKRQMKSSKQFRQKSTTSFSIKCDKCGNSERPKLVKDDVICGFCFKPLSNLSVPFKNMLKEKLKMID